MSLSENEIRPKDLMAGLYEEIEADRKWLVERKDAFVEVSCPGCGGTGEKELEKKELEYLRCGKCRTMYMSPRPSEALLHEFYEQSRTYAYWNEHIFPASEDVRRAKIFVPRAERILEFCDRYDTKKGTLLEIGAGFGTFCEEIQSRDAFERVIALEMTPDLAESCRGRGLEVIEEPVETVTLPDASIDVITSFETLEHLFSPKDFLTTVYRLLRKNGLLVVTCPSVDGFDVMMLREHSDTVDHEHVNYLNPESIRLLAEDCGFKVLEVLTPGELDADIVRNKVLDGKYSLEGQPWMQHVLIDRWDEFGGKLQEFLKDNRLSTHMWMIATVE